MVIRSMVCGLLLCAVVSTAHGFSRADAAAHDKEFWRAIVKNNFKVPDGYSASDLARELSDALGSPDPELRDELAFNILSTWIYRTRAVPPDVILDLSSTWVQNLANVNDSAPNAVLRRSFSALMLSIVAARDNADPFLSATDFRHLWQAALTYFRRETDLRGFDPNVGWVHSAAHTADLLKFLARSRYLAQADQAALLESVQKKLASAPVVFIYGEDERMARTVLSLVNRKDFDQTAFATWAKSMRLPPPAEQPTEAELRARQNQKNFLSKLFFLLSLSTNDPNSAAATAMVRDALRDTF